MAMRTNTLSVGATLIVPSFGRGIITGYYYCERKVYYWIYLVLYERRHIFSHSEVMPYYCPCREMNR